MRVIVLVLVLLIIGWLVARQLGDMADPGAGSTDRESEQATPRVPQRVQELPAFEGTMQRFVDDAARHRQERRDAPGQ
ncbi:hypothetical protein TVNIR_1402 [Thioalkalivibrio nitratireducens DSM 14787]|uniref:Uncharacterized protein n=1 Tax=Thioalkalivibrio nitratireducens (strain DSM 14787 / UNIQEM 213 / ALEN2) TaxID=1255043 RepID=L0DVN0_THIND|nr:hypothetical protein [Thioalkalivibrio nitratireducens]AGA33072.1 hypothetical protein TVNIR_1402 [Thioalkalivibrio nitratireducens DSM 14787]